MGIIHSIVSRFLDCKTEDEKGRRRPVYDPYPNLLHSRRQNRNPSCYGYSKSAHHRIFDKISNFHRLIFKAIKGLLQKVRFIFYPSRPGKKADPNLPVQNPAPPISTSDDDPISLVQPLLPPDEYSSTESNALLVDNSSHDNVDVVSSHQKWPLEYNSRKQMDCVVTAIPDPTHSLACTSATQEIVKSAVVTKQSTAIGINTSDQDHKKIIKSKVVVQVDAGIRWIKHYSSSHRILLVGEGDFSFSASLAVAFGWASNIIATSLDSEAFLRENYKKAPSNIKELKSRGSRVMHGIDATKMADHALLRHVKFDRIIYNFPFAGFFEELSRNNQLRRHRRLVSLFMKNAKEMISEDGEIHISHKTNGFHNEWNLVSIASSHGLGLIEEVSFNRHDYPGYNTKYGFGGDNNFNCYPAKTYKFGLKRVPSRINY